MSENTFTALGIRPELVNALMKDGVSEPTPIQAQAIPVLMKNKDLIGQAQTGTGKTLAFVLPMLEKINVGSSEVQGLIITPTRELAIQITAEIKKLAPIVGVNVLAAYGGQDVERQMHKLKRAIHIVVGTPGRLLDHLRRGTVHFGKLQMLVLDEADQMLHMGFLTDVQEILSQSSQRRQTMLFSATMPQQIRSLASHYMKTPLEISIASRKVTLDEIEQIVIETTDRGKQAALIKVLEEDAPYLGIIFCRTKKRASDLNKALVELGLFSDELHGDLSQSKREQVMKKFRDAKLQFLVATDIAARGLDIEGITHVYNYDVPQDADSYIHRIGRTGRAGHKGKAITFATPYDREELIKIEKGTDGKLRKVNARGTAETRDVGVPAERTGGKSRSGSRSGGREQSGGRGGRGTGGAGRGTGGAGRSAGGRGRGSDGVGRGTGFAGRSTEGAGRSAEGASRGAGGADRGASRGTGSADRSASRGAGGADRGASRGAGGADRGASRGTGSADRSASRGTASADRGASRGTGFADRGASRGTASADRSASRGTASADRGASRGAGGATARSSSAPRSGYASRSNDIRGAAASNKGPRGGRATSAASGGRGGRKR